MTVNLGSTLMCTRHFRPLWFSDVLVWIYALQKPVWLLGPAREIVNGFSSCLFCLFIEDFSWKQPVWTQASNRDGEPAGNIWGVFLQFFFIPIPFLEAWSVCFYNTLHRTVLHGYSSWCDCFDSLFPCLYNNLSIAKLQYVVFNQILVCFCLT